MEEKRRGRPIGSPSKLSMKAIEMARLTGNKKLPHEILLSFARGEMQEEQFLHPTLQVIHRRKVPVPLDMQLDAAKAAAPYFAPKISTVEVIKGVTDDDLDAIIASAAAQAGISVSLDGEGEEEEGDTGEAGDTEDGGGGEAFPARRTVTVP